MTSKLILGGVLAAQLLLGAGLFLDNARDTAATPEPLLAFSPSEANRIVIDDGTNATTLVLDGATWTLPGLQELPANGAKINTLLGKLSEVTTHWPVVASASGRERFEVSDAKHQRKLTLYRGETLLGSYYFGTSPGFRQTHVRREGEDEVYAVAFDNFDLPGDGNDWLNKSLLTVDGIDRIEGPDYVLTRADENWMLASAEAGDTPAPKEAEVTSLAGSWRNLRVMRAADAMPDDAEITVITLGAGDATWRYTVARNDEGCFMQREGLNATFTIAQGICDQIAGTRRADLVELPPEAVSDAAVGVDGASGGTDGIPITGTDGTPTAIDAATAEETPKS